MEEITAPVERIKQTDHSEAQSNPLPQEDEASPTPPVENAPTMADSPEALAPVAEERTSLLPENDAPATAEEVADAVSQIDIIPEETTQEYQAAVAVPQTETDIPDAGTATENESVAVSKSTSLQPVENVPAAEDSSVAELPQAEPEMPLVFVNGVPLPNGRSDLLDTMVVIDSAETDIGAEAPIVPDENMTEENITLDDLDAQNGDDIASNKAETDAESDKAEIESDTSNTDDEFLETIEQTVPIIPAKPAPPPPPRKKYAIPFDLLTNYPDGEYWIVDDATRRAALMLKSTFNEFKIDVSITGIRKGPVVTMFEMLPSPGIKDYQSTG